MTSYNREQLISQSIESVLNQNFTDFELIIVDDASTDGTWSIIQNYLSKDSRIKAYRNDKNIGDYPNRNKAAYYANRRFLKYLDSDDLLLPGALETMVAIMLKNPVVKIGLVGIGMGMEEGHNLELTPEDAYRMIFFRGKIIGCGPSFSIICRDAFWQLGGFSSNPFTSDLQFWLLALKVFHVCIFGGDLVYWREHDNQEFKRGIDSNYYLFNSFKIYENSLLSDDCPLNTDERKIAVRNLKNRYGRNIILSLMKGDISKSYKLFKSTSLKWDDFIYSLLPNKYPSF